MNAAGPPVGQERAAGIVGLVPIRAGSKGLPGKNVRCLAGVPLYHHAVQAGLDAGLDRVVVSTDIDEVLGGDHAEGVTVLRRPPQLCTDDASMGDVVLHAITAVPADATVVLLQATSPLRDRSDIRRALDLFQRGEHDLVMTVTETERSVRKYGEVTTDGHFVPLGDPADCFRNRQQLRPVHRPNGAVYVFGARWFRSNGGFTTDSIGAVVMSREASIDIDDEMDFARAEEILRGGDSQWR